MSERPPLLTWLLLGTMLSLVPAALAAAAFGFWLTWVMVPSCASGGWALALVAASLGLPAPVLLAAAVRIGRGLRADTPVQRSVLVESAWASLVSGAPGLTWIVGAGVALVVRGLNPFVQLSSDQWLSLVLLAPLVPAGLAALAARQVEPGPPRAPWSRAARIGAVAWVCVLLIPCLFTPTARSWPGRGGIEAATDLDAMLERLAVERGGLRRLFQQRSVTVQVWLRRSRDFLPLRGVVNFDETRVEYVVHGLRPFVATSPAALAAVIEVMDDPRMDYGAHWAADSALRDAAQHGGRHVDGALESLAASWGPARRRKVPDGIRRLAIRRVAVEALLRRESAVARDCLGRLAQLPQGDPIGGLAREHLASRGR